MLAFERSVESEQHLSRIDQLDQQRDRQVADGRCNVVPLPQVATRPFRTELTVEQNSLFVSNSFKGDHFKRESTVTNPDSGEEVIRRMTVGKVHEKEKRGRGVLTQMHQDVFYKILQLWGDRGYPLGEIESKTYGVLKVSAYELVTSLRSGDDNARGYRRVQELVQDLTSIPVVLENVYTWQGLSDREQFTLLGDVRWSDRRLDPRTHRPSDKGSSEVTILLSSFVTEGFLHQHLKLLLGKPYEELGGGRGRRGEIARLLYPFLDSQLSRKERFSANLEAITARFGLRTYRYKSKRREKFVPALRALDGKPIQGGQFRLRVELELSSTQDDFVLNAWREPVAAAE